MTTINCSSYCIYQQDGKCTYDKIGTTKLSIMENCAYFKPREEQGGHN